MVTGRVQGVFFRQSTREVAESLILNGHAINLPDGSVEVRACGADDAIDALGQWLRKGPRLASVNDCGQNRCELLATGRFHHRLNK